MYYRCHPEASSPLQVEAVYVSESDWYLPDPPEPECGTSRGKTPMVLVQRLPSSVVRRYINESNAHIFGKFFRSNKEYVPEKKSNRLPVFRSPVGGVVASVIASHPSRSVIYSPPTP